MYWSYLSSHGICILFHKSRNGSVPMSFCIVYDISVSLHVKFIVSRRIKLRSRNICFIYLLRWKCHFRWWRIKATDLKKFPNSQIVRALLECYPTCMWSEKHFIEILAAIFVNHVTFANWCKTLLNFIWLPFSYNLAKSNTFLHVSPKITEPDW